MFVTVGSPDEVAPGEVTVFDVNGVAIAVANIDGNFFAFDDTCTHRQCSLAEGELEDSTISCPCHGSQFDVTSGDVLNGPATEPVQTFDVRVDGENLQVDA